MSEWRNINDMYWRSPQSRESEAQPVDVAEDEPVQEEKGDEVKLIEGKWLPGEKGYQFNEKCKIQVKAEFLKDTTSTKVSMSTFVVYNGEEEDLKQQVEANIKKETGIAEAEVTLFYGEKYYEDYSEDPSVKCEYKFTAHSNVCKNDVESELLEMPERTEQFIFSM